MAVWEEVVGTSCTGGMATGQQRRIQHVAVGEQTHLLSGCRVWELFALTSDPRMALVFFPDPLLSRY